MDESFGFGVFLALILLIPVFLVGGCVREHEIERSCKQNGVWSNDVTHIECKSVDHPKESK